MKTNFMSHWLSPPSFCRSEQNIVLLFTVLYFNLQNPNWLRESHNASLVLKHAQVWPSPVPELDPLVLCIICNLCLILGLADSVPTFSFWALILVAVLIFSLTFLHVDTERGKSPHDNFSLSFLNSSYNLFSFSWFLFILCGTGTSNMPIFTSTFQHPALGNV